MAQSSTRPALLELYLWATGSDRHGNPYSKPAVRSALRALGSAGYDLPRARPRERQAAALYDLVVWATGPDRNGNPHSKPAVRQANLALGGDGYDLPAGMHPNAHKHGTYPAQRARYVVTVRHASGAEDPSFAAGEYGDTPVDVAHRAAQALHGPAHIRVFDRETKVSLMYRATDGDVTHISTSETRMRFPQQTPNARHDPNVVQFSPGDRLDVRHHKSQPGQGLSYPDMTVIAKEEGRGGQHSGWDVYDGETEEGREVSFYGFSVVRKARGRQHANVHKMGKSLRRNASETEIAETAPILNPGDADWKRGALVRLWFGQVGTTFLYYWGNLEDGFEAAVEWADEHAPGLLTQIGPEEYQSAAEDEGIEWQDSWPDWDDPEFQRVVEAAEADMTLIGHTTLKHGNAVPSYEWGGDDVTDKKEREIVGRRSAVEANIWEECGDIDDLKRAAETYGVPDEEHTPVWGDEPKDKVEETLRGLADAGRLISWDTESDPQEFLWQLQNGKLVVTQRAVEYEENASGSDKVLRAAESGRYANAGSFHTAGGVIYSYDLPIADLRKEPFLVVSKDSLDAAGKLSVTTSKHIGFVMRGLPKNLIRVVDYGVVRDAVLTKNRRR